jgi:hypothetical protein
MSFHPKAATGETTAPEGATALTSAGVEPCFSCRRLWKCAHFQNINRRCRRVAVSSSRWPPALVHKVLSLPPAIQPLA